MPVRSSGSIERHLAEADLHHQLALDVRIGLAEVPKWIPATWFYDDEGSRLFDEITRLPEYYPTRTERAILLEAADGIATRTRARTLVEIGSGTSDKTTLLLDALSGAGSLEGFVPFDVSESTLREAMDRLAERYERLDLHGVVGDFRRHLPLVLERAREISDGAPTLVAFLGGTIGNLNPDERVVFLTEMARGFGPADRLLLGTDLEKDRHRLVAAYDDSRGVTAEFNRNVLRVLNRELGADFDVDAFEHVAAWSEVDRRIEMHLRAGSAQDVHIAELDMAVHFDEREMLLTEISCKFTYDHLAAELEEAGFTVDEAWTDPEGDYLVTLARPR